MDSSIIGTVVVLSCLGFYVIGLFTGLVVAGLLSKEKLDG